MAQGNHFLNIPKQEGLFTTIKSGRAGEQRDDSAVEDEDEEETEEDVRLIPRCSPIPRKRGHSIADETAEYMRIRLVLSRRVSFADATGGDLVDVREFVAFDSGDENDDSNREEEEANCRRAYLEPVYRIWPEFSGRSGNDLTHSVRANKVDVESVTPVAEDPLAFDALICVLNVSYHKCVFVRFTMDGWITHTDCPAQYVQGSNQGDTDKFSARLSFSEPYLFNGARIDFVVRYETSECEFWANNSGRNYSVTLLVSHEDTSQVNKLDTQEIRGILKPPRYRMGEDYDIFQDSDEGEWKSTEREAAADVFHPVSPHVIEPEIDIEIAEVQAVSPSKTREDHYPAENVLPSGDASYDEQPLQDFSAIPLTTSHIGTKVQDTKSPIATENITVSIQKCTETKPDNDTKSYSDRQVECSAKSNPSFSPKQVDSHSDIMAQVPFDLDTALPDMWSSVQDVKDGESEKRENKEVQSEVAHRKVQQHDQASDKMKVDETTNLHQELQESTQSCPFNELITGSERKGEVDCSKSTCHDTWNPLVEKSKEYGVYEMQTEKLDAAVRNEARSEEQAALIVESFQASEDEALSMVTSCIFQPLGIIHMGQTEVDIVSQSVSTPPRTTEPEVFKYQEQPKISEAEIKEFAGTESRSLTEDMPVLISKVTPLVQDFTTTVEVSEGEDDSVSLTQEEQDELLPYEEFELYFTNAEPDILRNQDGLENQLPLPSETSQAFSALSNEILGKTLIPSLIGFSVVVCLAVGFHTPSIFLIMVLFLVSLCF